MFGQDPAEQAGWMDGWGGGLFKKITNIGWLSPFKQAPQTQQKVPESSPSKSPSNRSKAIRLKKPLPRPRALRDPNDKGNDDDDDDDGESTFDPFVSFSKEADLEFPSLIKVSTEQTTDDEKSNDVLDIPWKQHTEQDRLRLSFIAICKTEEP